ncbi:MAG: class I SAM-dependent methyltransferase, partial [Patescibacteria group bacterium]
MKEYIPEKYKIEPRGETAYGEIADKLVNQETGEWFFLTGRSFKGINHSFAKLPSRAIERLREVRPKEKPIRILDIGGGIEARAAGDIADKYHDEEDKQVQVFSLDLTARKKDKQGLHQIAGDALNLPLKDNSIDVAYSRMSISLLEESKPETLVQALKEAARTLRPGGVLFLDKTYTERLGRTPNYEEFQKLSNELGVAFYSKELGLFLGPLERILNKLNK